MTPGLGHVILVVVVWIEPRCEQDSAISDHTHGFDTVRMHPYGHLQHLKVLIHFTFIKEEIVIVIQLEVTPGLGHVILVEVVWFEPRNYWGGIRGVKSWRDKNHVRKIID